LKGFCVRLTGKIALSYECVYLGSFAGVPELVEARNGEGCVAQSGANLEAMQVVFRHVKSVAPGAAVDPGVILPPSITTGLQADADLQGCAGQDTLKPSLYTARKKTKSRR
jgi:hypothetical protein